MSKRDEFFELLDEVLTNCEQIVEDKENEDAVFEEKIAQLEAFNLVLNPEEEEEVSERTVEATLVSNSNNPQ